MRLISSIKYIKSILFISFILSSCCNNNSSPISRSKSFDKVYCFNYKTTYVPISLNDTIYSKVGSQLQFIVKNAPKDIEIEYPNNVDCSGSETFNDYVIVCNFIQDSFAPIELTDKSTNEKFKFYLAGIPDTISFERCDNEEINREWGKVINDTIDVEDSVLKNKIKTEIKENFIPQNGQLIYNTLACSNYNTITNGSFDMIMGSNDNHLTGSFIIAGNKLNMHCNNGIDYYFNILNKSQYASEGGGWYYITGQNYTDCFKKEYPFSKINKVCVSSLIIFNPVPPT